MSRRRFLALLDAGDELTGRVRAQAAPGMKLYRDSPGLLFLSTSNVPVRLSTDGNGVVWGELFARMANTAPCPELDASRFALPDLIRKGWGGYIAIRRDEASSAVLRGPSGPNSCYFTRAGAGVALASDAALLADFGLIRPAVDWAALAGLLLYRESRPQHTALEDVQELLPGTILHLVDGVCHVRPAWTPALHVEPSTLDLYDAAEHVREETLCCVGSWARRFDRPLLELSGGLDSSIVATALASAGSAFHCLSYAATGSDLDETGYARAVADALGIPIDIVTPDAEAVMLAHSTAAHLPRPHARSFIQETDRLSRVAAERLGADAFFSGNGGDNVFCFLSSAAPVVDRWDASGARAAWRTARNVAEICEVGHWEVVAKAIARRHRPAPNREWFRTPEFLDPEFAASIGEPPLHPWLAACDAAPAGKRAHVAALLRIQNYLEGHDRLEVAPIIAPLLSQPLVELCLSIPSWLWCAGGRNRAVARAAFSGQLPPVTISRQAKGSFAGMVSRILERRRDTVRSMLLDGLLARHALLDRVAVEVQLRDDVPVPGPVAGRLLGLVDAEAWAQAWQGRPRS